MVTRPNRRDTPIPLRELSRPPHNLPLQPSPLLGRDDDIAAVRSRLLDSNDRLLTLTGPPGTGKTRLALAVAGEVAGDYSGGVWYVGLENLREPDQVTSAITQVLGVREVTGQPLAETLAAQLADQRLLLVLDNFEQVLTAGVQIADLLGTCPHLKVLATSRALLHLRWEHELPVAPLDLPDRGRLHDPDAVAESAAVQLFVQQARALQPDFHLTLANVADVAAICYGLDGLPLAIELAASRVKLLAPRAIRERLEHRLHFLTSGPRDLPARQQTLRAALAWSYDLLATDEQALFQRLGVFAGGCTLEAVEAVAARLHEPDLVPRPAVVAALSTEEGLAALLGDSLVQREAGPDGEPRYRMLETLREYALEHLTAAGGLEESQRRHAEYYLHLAETAQPQLLAGGQQAIWHGRLEAEHENIQAALAWATTTEGEGEIGVRLGGALFRYWSVRGYLSEGRHWLERVLAVGADTPAPARRKALNAAGLMARQQGDYERAQALHEECLRLARHDGDRRSVAVSLINLALVAQHGRADLATARAQYEESLTLMKELGDTWGMAAALNNLGGLAIRMADYAAAEAALEECLALHRTLDNTEGIAHALGYLGTAALRQGDLERAAALVGQSLTHYATLGDRQGVSQCIEDLAGVAAARSRPERAARLLGAAAAMREALEIPGDPADRAAVEATALATRAALGDAGYEAAWEAGRTMSLEQAVAAAVQPDDTDAGEAETAPERSPAPHARASRLPDKLTAREVEVLRLIAAGQSTREIAAALVISDRTVERHVSNLYAKIGARGRADATAYAFQHDLTAPTHR